MNILDHCKKKEYNVNIKKRNKVEEFNSFPTKFVPKKGMEKMRIISGKARGTKLYTLEGKNTRPTLDRVKESLFNIIQTKIPGSVFLDLFSGSGAIGLEAVSRGAKKAILCDKEKSAIQIIKKNIEKTHLEEQIELYQLPFEKLLKDKIKEKLDIIYIDPPYKTDYAYQATKIIMEKNLTKEETIIIIETDEEEIKEQIKELEVEIIDQRKYGRAHLIFLKESKIN